MLDEIAAYLAENGLGKFSADEVLPDSDIFLEGLVQSPPGVLECISLQQYGGSGRLDKELDGVEFLNLQITARGNNPLELIEKLNRIVDLLDQTRPTIGGHFYPAITAKQAPFKAWVENNDTFVYAVNFNVDRRFSLEE